MDRRTIRVRGGELSYLAAEPAAPRGRVLLLHGGGADSAALSWGGLLGPLAEAGYAAYAPDAPGYGHSDPPRGRQDQAALEVRVAELVGLLGLEDAVVVGLSMGGGTALGYALARAGAGRPLPGLVLLGSYGLMPTMGGPLAHLAAWAWVRTRLGPAATRLVARRPAWVRASLASLVRDPASLPPGVVAEVTAALRGPSPGVFEQWQLSEIGPRRFRTDHRDRLGELACPVLFIHGERDPGVPLARVREAAHRIDRAEVVVVPGGRHWVQRDAPGATLAALTAFLERTCPAP